MGTHTEIFLHGSQSDVRKKIKRGYMGPELKHQFGFQEATNTEDFNKDFQETTNTETAGTAATTFNRNSVMKANTQLRLKRESSE